MLATGLLDSSCLSELPCLAAFPTVNKLDVAETQIKVALDDVIMTEAIMNFHCEKAK